MWEILKGMDGLDLLLVIGTICLLWFWNLGKNK